MSLRQELPRSVSGNRKRLPRGCYQGFAPFDYVSSIEGREVLQKARRQAPQRRTREAEPLREDDMGRNAANSKKLSMRGHCSKKGRSPCKTPPGKEREGESIHTLFFSRDDMQQAVSALLGQNHNDLRRRAAALVLAADSATHRYASLCSSGGVLRDQNTRATSSIAAIDVHVCSEQMLAETQAKLRETQQRSEHLLHLCSQGEPLEETDRTFHDGKRVHQSSSARYLLDSCEKRIEGVSDGANVKQAAVKIQSRVRGMQSRRRVAKRTKQRNDAEKVAYWRHEQEETADNNQARNQGPNLDRERENEEDERKHCAAVKIQARHRGMRDRQRLREEDERKHCAAVKIQSRVRGVRSRQQVRELGSQRDHQGECTDPEIPIAKEAGTDREGVMVLEAELQNARGRDNSPVPPSPPSPSSMPSPPSISLASSVSFAEEISQVFEMNCREEDDLERATEIQEKLRSWMDEGGHRDKDKDRVIRLEKEQQTESDPIAKMQQRMEKGPLLLQSPMLLPCSCLPYSFLQLT